MHVLDSVRRFEQIAFEGQALLPHRGESLPPGPDKPVAKQACDRCEVTKPLGDFYTDFNGGVLRICKLCTDARRKGNAAERKPRRHPKADAIEAALRAGGTHDEIRNELGVCADTIRKVRQAAGIEVVHGRPRHEVTAVNCSDDRHEDL